MDNLAIQLTKTVSAAFEQAGYDASYGAVMASNRPDLCDFQCNGALAAAKVYKKSPLSIAQEVAQLIPGAEAVAPGFINIRAENSMIAARLNAMLEDERLLLPKTDTPRKIVMDYGGPNVAKALHIGHLRSAIIGDALYRIVRFLGHNAISDVHLGDWGQPMGLVIASLLERGIKVSDLSPDELNEVYPVASKRSKEDAEFLAESQRITKELQQGNPEYYAIWQELHAVSVADVKKNYDSLNLLDFDYWYGESDAQKYVEAVLERLEEKGLLTEEGGAKIVHVKREDDKEPIPPLIVLKNGTEMYCTTDLATIYQRERDFNPDEAWYFTDARQNLYFKQIFRCAGMSGISGMRFSHTGFGTVNGSDGKPYKTRSGGVMRLADMIDEVRGKLPDPMIACAAIRIADLQNRPIKDYIFDLDKFTAKEGKTGPYLQYTAVRIASVLAKAELVNCAIGAPAVPSERALMLALDSAGDSITKAFEEKAPNAICDALFDISAKFNTFYGECRILSEPNDVQRGSWLALLKLTRRMLEILLYLLGVEIPEAM
ncbi:MAG: arginine--tRNA ligase [Oscillospiraceae bacterium]|jgi:arginyl-tRNA synthetase|nr:arginine--tRNA ligase [Oscillospiraceae bacterium]